jgi:hypothetical protein
MMSHSTLDLLQHITAIAGIFCVGLSTYLAGRFHGSGHPLGAALSVMLLGEAFVGLFTVLFAFLTAFGYSWDAHPFAQMAMRWAIFAAASITSLHLAYHVWDIGQSHPEADDT